MIPSGLHEFLAEEKSRRERERGIGLGEEKNKIKTHFLQNFHLIKIEEMNHMAAAKLEAMCQSLSMQGLPNGRKRKFHLLPRVAPSWRHVSRAPGPEK